MSGQGVMDRLSPAFQDWRSAQPDFRSMQPGDRGQAIRDYIADRPPMFDRGGVTQPGFSGGPVGAPPQGMPVQGQGMGQGVPPVAPGPQNGSAPDPRGNAYGLRFYQDTGFRPGAARTDWREYLAGKRGR